MALAERQTVQRPFEFRTWLAIIVEMRSSHCSKQVRANADGATFFDPP